MNTGWIVFILCLLALLGAALPLINRRNDTPLPPPQETLRDWRNKK